MSGASPKLTWLASSGAPLEVLAPGSPLGTPEASRYEDGPVLGRGGWGVVRRCHDRRLGRDVALKTVHHVDAEAMEDLEREARLTACLDHPNIVSVHDAGVDHLGRPYYTMPVLTGRSLASCLEGLPLEARLARVRHVLDAARAMAYAHSQGLLHRDLKPANLMVGSYGETQVADWGLACTLEEAQTGVPPRQGTPGYMSPEATAGGTLDSRTDVYSLGAVLHELLVGRPPPPPPVAPATHTVPGAPAELADIARRAMAARLDERYPDAAALALDLDAWFAGRRVAAHRYSLREELSRRVSRHRWALGAGLAGAVSLAALAVLSWHNTASERDRARQAQLQAESAREMADSSLALALAAHARQAASQGDQAAAEVLAASALEHGDSADARGVLARFGGAPSITVASRWQPEHCSPIAVSHDGRLAGCLDSGGQLDVIDISAETVLATLPGVVSHGVFAGRTHRLIAASDDGLHSWTPADGVGPVLSAKRPEFKLTTDPATGAVASIAEGQVLTLSPAQQAVVLVSKCPTGSMPTAVVPEPNGGLVLACSNRGIGRIGEDLVWRASHLLSVEEGVPSAIAMATDRSGHVAVGTARGQVVLLDETLGRVLQRFDTAEHTIYDLAVYGERVAAATTDGSVWVWDVPTGAVLARLQPGLSRLSWHDGGRRLRSRGRAVTEWTVPTATLVRRHAFAEGVTSVHPSPTGDLVAVGAGDGSVRVLDALLGTTRATLSWTTAVIKDVAFSPDGRRLAAAAATPEGMRIFDTRDFSVSTQRPGGVRRLAWDPEGSLTFLPYRPGLYRLHRGVEQRFLAEHALWELDSDSSGTLVGLDKREVLWRWDEGGLRSLGTHHGVGAVAPWGARTLTAGQSLTVLGPRGQVERSWPLPAAGVDATVSPDGKLVAIGHLDGMATVWRLETGTLLARLVGHTARVASVAFSPDGRWLWTGSWDRSARVWSVEAMTAEVEDLRREREQAWGMTLDAALQRAAR